MTSLMAPTHRELIDLICFLKDSTGQGFGLDGISKTKIRSILALLKHGELLLTEGIEGEPVKLFWMKGINSFPTLRIKHDEFLLRYCIENHLFLTFAMKNKLMWCVCVNNEEEMIMKNDKINYMDRIVSYLFEIIANAGDKLPIRGKKGTEEGEDYSDDERAGTAGRKKPTSPSLVSQPFVGLSSLDESKILSSFLGGGDSSSLALPSLSDGLGSSLENFSLLSLSVPGGSTGLTLSAIPSAATSSAGAASLHRSNSASSDGSNPSDKERKSFESDGGSGKEDKRSNGSFTKPSESRILNLVQQNDQQNDFAIGNVGNGKRLSPSNYSNEYSLPSPPVPSYTPASSYSASTYNRDPIREGLKERERRELSGNQQPTASYSSYSNSAGFGGSAYQQNGVASQPQPRHNSSYPSRNQNQPAPAPSVSNQYGYQKNGSYYPPSSSAAAPQQYPSSTQQQQPRPYYYSESNNDSYQSHQVPRGEGSYGRSSYQQHQQQRSDEYAYLSHESGHTNGVKPNYSNNGGSAYQHHQYPHQQQQHPQYW
jgi:hypothetical protein